MRDTVLRLGRPYVERYIANQAGYYLTERRRRRLAKQLEEVIAAELQPIELSVEAPGRNLNVLWFSLAGLLLGSAIGTMIYLLTRNSR